MKLLLTFCFIILRLISLSQEDVLSRIPLKGQTSMDFVPAGYKIITTEKGDLNKDGITDIVMGLAQSDEDTLSANDEEVKRILVVLLGKKGIYELGGVSENILWCKICDGLLPDPLQSIQIQDGYLEIRQKGANTVEWVEVQKFLYKIDGFYLVYSMRDMHHFGGCNGKTGNAGKMFKAVNFVSGDEEIIETDGECKVLTNRKGKIAIKPLVRMENFVSDN